MVPVVALPGITIGGILAITTGLFDFRVDYTQDLFPPCPQFTYPEGSNISIVSVLVTYFSNCECNTGVPVGLYKELNKVPKMRKIVH